MCIKFGVSRIVQSFVVVFVLSFFLPFAAKAEGANLYLSPTTGTYVLGETFSLVARVNTGGEVINVAEGNLSFDKDVLELVSVNRAASPLTQWPVEPTYSNAAGTVNFAGGVPQTGFKGADGYLVRLDFKSKRVGATRVNFSTGSALANDGKGTNILTAMSGAAIVISPKVDIVNPEIPTDATKVDEKTEQKTDDKVTAEKALAATSTRPDMTPPTDFEALIENVVDSWPILKLSAKDSESGLDKYRVVVDGLEAKSFELGVLASSTQLHDLNPGSHKVLIEVFDKAGNKAVKTLDFEIAALPEPMVKDYAHEVKSDGQFFINGTATPNGEVEVTLKKDGQIASVSTVLADSNGNWFFVTKEKLADGNYTLSSVVKNNNGLRSEPSKDISFAVTPPVMVVAGDYAIKYFTLFTSLLFVILLIVVGSVYLYRVFRGRVRKESHEVGQILKSYLGNFSEIIDEEFIRLSKYEGTPAYKREKDKTRRSLKARLGIAERKVLKEVDDVEKVMR